MITRLFAPHWIYTLGWTLVDTLWIGAAFALLLGICLVLMRRFSAQARYTLAIGLLFAFVATTLLTGYRHYQTAPVPSTVLSTASGSVVNAATLPDTETLTHPKATSSAEVTPSFRKRLVNYYDQHLPLIVTIWLMGVLVLQLRLLGQLAVVQRLKSYGTTRFPKRWATAFQQLEEQFDIEKSVRYLTSTKVASPMVIGWLRPVVLFPNFLLEKLQENEIIGILAHELAHVKRNDFIVNIVQNILCTLFFYHPGIWWMSARIEEEREHCCDDMAIAATGQAMTLAKTLIHLKEQELTTPRLAAAFTGRQRGFKHRIQRMITGYLRHATYGEGIITTLILVFAIGAISVVNGQGVTEKLTTHEQRAIEQPVLVQDSLSVPITTNDQAAPPPPSLPPDADQRLENTAEESSLVTETTTEPTIVTSVITTRDGPHQHTEIVSVHSHSSSTPCGQLLAAIRNGDRSVVEALLASVDVNCVDPDPAWQQLADDRWEEDATTALNTAARIGRLDLIKLMVETHGANINQYAEGDGTPLLTAAAYGHLNIVTYLVGKGANPNEQFPNQGTAIMQAAYGGHVDLIRYLSQYSSSLESGTFNQGTLLITAANNGNLETLRFLLEQGAQVDTRTSNQGTALIAAANNGHLEAIQLLIDAGANVNLQTSNQGTALIAAANNGHVKVVRLLLENGADRNLYTTNQGTPLICAANNGHVETVRYLLEQGVEIDLQTPNQGSALLAAANNGEVAVAELLLRKGADANQISANHGTALIAAANNGALKMVQLLLAKGADPDLRVNNTTALTAAANNGHTDVMQYLMNLKQ